MTDLWRDIGITPSGALAVVVSTVVMYVVLAFILHQWGHRLRSSGSSATMALAALIGAIAARSALGNHPTLAGGLVALTTLLAMERVFGILLPAVRRAEHRPGHIRPTRGARR